MGWKDAVTTVASGGLNKVKATKGAGKASRKATEYITGGFSEDVANGNLEKTKQFAVGGHTNLQGEIWSKKGGFMGSADRKRAEQKAEEDKQKKLEKRVEKKKAEQEVKDTADIEKQKAEQTGFAKEISGNLQKASESINKAGEDYNKKSEGLSEETKKLSKYTEGIETSYEKIAQRYRDAFDEADKLRVKEQQIAQRDYAANAALMSKAAAVGMQGQGPMTGAQQQLMMAGAQQQATAAYSAAQDRMQSMQMQRQELGAQVVQQSMQQEMQNRQTGYNLDAQSIQARNILNTQQYGTTMTGIEAQTNAANYMPQAQMGISNTAMQTNLAMRGLREGVANAGYQIGMAQNQQVPQPSQFGTGIQRGIAGAGTGFAVGGGWGALAGGALGFASSYME